MLRFLTSATSPLLSGDEGVDFNTCKMRAISLVCRVKCVDPMGGKSHEKRMTGGEFVKLGGS